MQHNRAVDMSKSQYRSSDILNVLLQHNVNVNALDTTVNNTNISKQPNLDTFGY